MAELNFKEIVARAHFDYVGPEFPEWWKNNKKQFVLPSLKKIFGNNALGKQYFFTLNLSYNGEKFTLPNEPLISLSSVKTIVETATVGKYRKGTVKEYINTEDYHITIRGVCINDDFENYPAEQVGILNKLFEINDTLKVESNWFFALFGIENIVLKEMKFDEMIGQPYLQRYVITAISDQPFLALLEEQDEARKNILNTK